MIWRQSLPKPAPFRPGGLRESSAYALPCDPADRKHHLGLDREPLCCTIVQNMAGGLDMDIAIDTSALLAVIVGEPERAEIIKITSGNTLIGPGSIPWEVGHAFSAMFRQKSLSLAEAGKGISIFNSIPIRYIESDFINVLKISRQADIYAYDAYFLDCAARQKAPLLTLDQRLKAAAVDFNIKTVEL